MKFWNVKLRGCWRHAGFAICKRQTGRLGSNSKYEATKFQLVFYPTASSHEMYDMSHECCIPGAVATQIRSTCRAQDSPYQHLSKMKPCSGKHTSYHHIIQLLSTKTSCNKKGLPRESRFHDSHPLKSPYLKCHWLQKSLQFWKKNLCSCGTCAKGNALKTMFSRFLVEDVRKSNELWKKKTVSKQLAPLVPPKPRDKIHVPNFLSYRKAQKQRCLQWRPRKPCWSSHQSS